MGNRICGRRLDLEGDQPSSFAGFNENNLYTRVGLLRGRQNSSPGFHVPNPAALKYTNNHVKSKQRCLEMKRQKREKHAIKDNGRLRDSTHKVMESARGSTVRRRGVICNNHDYKTNNQVIHWPLRTDAYEYPSLEHRRALYYPHPPIRQHEGRTIAAEAMLLARLSIEDKILHKQLKSAVSNKSTNHSALIAAAALHEGGRVRCEITTVRAVSPRRNKAMSVIFDGKWSKEDLIWGTRARLGSDEKSHPPPPLVQQGIEEELSDAPMVQTFDQSGTAAARELGERGRMELWYNDKEMYQAQQEDKGMMLNARPGGIW
ncbi:hypothetical protein CBL_10731 [Carabus blaptoides fortunei]